MRELLLYLVKSLVDHPEAVEVKEREDQGIIILSLKVDAEDMGKVIGKGGKIIKSLRSILRILAIKEAKRVELELEEVVG